MTGLKATKRALISSVIALFLCFAMLLGTTYAWFTDSATSAGNTITTGTLDVELYKWTDATTSVGLSQLAKDDPNADTSVFNAAVLWEPGHTEVAYLSIKNNGSLALKYKVAVVATLGADTDGDKADITDVMLYEISPDKKFGEVTFWNGADAVKVEVGTNAAAEGATLLKDEEHFFALSVHMDENAGNKYQNETVVFDIIVLAGQLASEADSFGPTYDADADYAKIPNIDYATVVAGTSAYDFEIRDEAQNKIAAATVPGEAVAGDATDIKVKVVESNYNANITVGTESETKAFDVTVTGLKENNDIPVAVDLKIPVGLNPATVVLYHYDSIIPSSYNPHTGYVSFESKTFSPFTVVYDAESVYVAPVVNPDAAPTATVATQPQYVGVSLPWGSYGQWSPDKNVDADPKLEAAYVFTCNETFEQAKDNKYANWYCDFYVKLDKDLDKNQIFLGGNYGSFGWVGFHNGDVTLSANTEIGLLESVTTNPWTYLDVAQFVGTFVCGVGDVNNALAGATFTVMLRLTNPENPDDFINVETINYTFN